MKGELPHHHINYLNFLPYFNICLFVCLFIRRMDFRMNIYNCISMEHRLGMIEVVLNAETIANIQKEKGMFSATSPFKKGSLYSWLKEFNKSDEEMNKAINEFTLSCAGYCVATYVLGVADRHSDNIMVKKNGQVNLETLLPFFCIKIS